jgi:hypothetical protein
MIGLFFSELILLVAAAAIGFGVGWRLYVLAGAARKSEAARDVDALRAAWSDAQARRARIS